MFQALSKLIKESGLRGIDMNVKAVGESDTLSVMLSFNQATEFEMKLLEKSDDATVSGNADKVMALRAALNTPMAIIGEPNEIIGKVEQALANLSEGITGAATAYSALDISALLTKAAAQAKAAKGAEKPKAKTDKGKATTEAAKQAVPEPELEEEQHDDAEIDGEQESEAVEVVTKAPAAQAKAEKNVKPTEAPSQPSLGGFDAFDSL